MLILPFAFDSVVRPAVRIALFHGNRLVGELLRRHCTETLDCEVEMFANVPSAAAAKLASPNIIVIRHEPPRHDGVHLLAQLRAMAPAARILFIASQLTEFLVQRLADHPPHAVCEECSDGIEGLRESLLRLREGTRWISPRYAELQARLRSPAGAYAMCLTKREQAVLRCVAHAMNDEQIGRYLGIATRTAKRHRMSIAAKLSLRSSPQELIRFGVEKGFAAEPPPPINQAAPSSPSGPDMKPRFSAGSRQGAPRRRAAV